VAGRALALGTALLLLCGGCGDGDTPDAGRSAVSTPPSTRPATEPVTTADPLRAADLCAAREGLVFFDSWVSEGSGAPSARGAARPWLGRGEHLGTAPGGPGRRVVSLSGDGQVREVLTVRRQRSTGQWHVLRTTGCLTVLPTASSCGDVVQFGGTTYHRPTYHMPGPGDQIGVGRPFGQGRIPACADVTAYVGHGRHLVGAVAPVTVYQEEEVPMADSVVTSPVSALGPRIYDAS
jgi:hypothetical protein